LLTEAFLRKASKSLFLTELSAPSFSHELKASGDLNQENKWALRAGPGPRLAFHSAPQQLIFDFVRWPGANQLDFYIFLLVLVIFG
jgi:hypothetical protein